VRWRFIGKVPRNWDKWAADRIVEVVIEKAR